MVTHDTYADSFQKDLTEAVTTAQSNMTEAEKKQAGKYGKLVKGVPQERQRKR